MAKTATKKKSKKAPKRKGGFVKLTMPKKYVSK
jgi:hypothetical protein